MSDAQKSVIQKADQNGEAPSLICIFIDQNTLHKYAAENNIPKQGLYKDKALIDLTGNVFLKGFFDSLLPYLNEPKKLPKR
ncbi:hypothetical protein [Chitinophaga pinensis]|uniref:hypothetical protein n=1 Tax=Chitinophaga pinensis TaxID=79329 RepID=UPI00019E3DBD|nr:hypothetical protein [Chitinophaga pinensis]